MRIYYCAIRCKTHITYWISNAHYHESMGAPQNLQYAVHLLKRLLHEVHRSCSRNGRVLLNRSDVSDEQRRPFCSWKLIYCAINGIPKGCSMIRALILVDEMMDPETPHGRWPSLHSRQKIRLSTPLKAKAYTNNCVPPRTRWSHWLCRALIPTPNSAGTTAPVASVPWSTIGYGTVAALSVGFESGRYLLRLGGNLIDIRIEVAVLYTRLGHKKEALQYYQQALKLITPQHQREHARIVGNIGLLHQSFGEFDPAIEHYNTALQIFTSIEELDKCASIKGNLGTIYMQQKYLTAKVEYLNLEWKIQMPNFFQKIQY